MATVVEKWLKQCGIDLTDLSRQKLEELTGDLNDLTLFYFVEPNDINNVFEGHPKLKLRKIHSLFQTLKAKSNAPKRKVELELQEEEEKKELAKKKRKTTTKLAPDKQTGLTQITNFFLKQMAPAKRKQMAPAKRRHLHLLQISSQQHLPALLLISLKTLTKMEECCYNFLQQKPGEAFDKATGMPLRNCWTQ